VNAMKDGINDHASFQCDSFHTPRYRHRYEPAELHVVCIGWRAG
jgi:hypothetical protein